MSKYIKQDKAIKIVESHYRVDNNLLEVIAYQISNLPPEDVQPVVHGEWEEDHWCGEKARRCSVCHITQTVNVYKGKVMYQYCPYCGAKMNKRKGAGDEVN